MTKASHYISNGTIPDNKSERKRTADPSDASINAPEITSAKKILENSPFKDKNDVELWETFKSGDESAFIYIYSKYFNELIHYGYQFTTDVCLIEDCVQDLFIKLRKSRSKLGIIKKSIRLYLLISLKRRLLESKIKPNKRERIVSEVSKEFEIVVPRETHLIQEDIFMERRKSLEIAMNQLTRKQREAIYYIYYKNFSFAEAKIIMQINSEKTLRNLIYRAIGSMRSIMKYISVFLFTIIQIAG